MQQSVALLTPRPLQGLIMMETPHSTCVASERPFARGRQYDLSTYRDGEYYYSACFCQFCGERSETAIFGNAADALTAGLLAV